MAAKKGTKTRKGRGVGVNKSEFIRNSGDVPAKEVVAAAAKQGIKISEKMVYNIRSAAKAKVKAVKTTARRVGRSATGAINSSEQWIRHALDLGIDRAIATLERIKHAMG
jgi:hypothetical protein